MRIDFLATEKKKWRDALRAMASKALIVIFALSNLLTHSPSARAYITDGAQALDVIGQYDRTAVSSTPGSLLFEKKSQNGGATKLGFNNNQAIVLDAVNHRFFVADANNRVLIFNLNADNTFIDKVADFVLGQPDFSDTAARTTQSGMASPGGLAVDSANKLLFVADFATTNSRVLVYDLSGGITNGMNASFVIGQPNFTTGTLATTQAGMRQPFDIDYDSAGKRLFVADFNNNRVLVYDLSGGITNGMNAAYVIGQADYVSSTVALTQASLRTPGGIVYDSVHDRLFVSEFNNSRILVYDVRPSGSAPSSLCGTSTTGISNGMNASCVLGQTLFTTNAAATTQSGLRFAIGMSYDATHDRLYVADRSNHRVLMFNTASLANGMNASSVLGQANFTTNTAAVTQSGMNLTQHVLYDSAHDLLYVSDILNNRITVFNVATITDGEDAVDVIGQYVHDSENPLTVTYTRGGVNNGPTTFGFNRPTGEALDAVNHRLFVVDTLNNRVLVFNLTADDTMSDRVADFVLGQSDFGGKDAATTQSRMNFPEGVAYDGTGNRLFVADALNHRVLVFNAAALSNGMNASNVIGQPNFTSATINNTTFGGGCTTAPNACSMNNPFHLSFDSAGNRLLVADRNNHRVTVFNTAAITDGMAASNVLGQAVFTTNAAATTATGMNNPEGLAYDKDGRRLFVAERTNNRVLAFNLAVITDGMAASNVLGQPSFTTSAGSTAQARLNGPEGVAYDAVNKRLLVTERTNHRILAFDVSPFAPSGSGSCSFLIRPNGGEKLVAGESYEITWSRSACQSQAARISLSTDGGATYPTVIADNESEDGSYTWSVPNVTTMSAKVKVELLMGGIVQGSDASDGDFSITGNPGASSTPSPTTPIPPTATTPYDPADERDQATSIDQDQGWQPTSGPQPCIQGTALKSVSSKAVYYCGSDGKKHVFPNEKTYMTWFSDFSHVMTFSDESVASIPEGKTITYRPGVKMIKLNTDEKTYAVAAGGTRRWVETETVASKLYGAFWNTKIDDLLESLFDDYTAGESIR